MFYNKDILIKQGGWMNEKSKLTRLTELYDEMIDLFPKGSLSINLHSIKEKYIPKKLFKYDGKLLNCDDTKTWKYKNKNNNSFYICLYVDKKDQND